MTLKGVTLAEKLRLAHEAGVTLPHYTNTENPVDFPKSQNKMNERIKELAKQAGFNLPNNLVEGVNGPGVVTEKDKLEKFAELIVRECINEIAYIGKANEVFGDRTDKGGLDHILWTTETAIEKIKQHFEIEE